MEVFYVSRGGHQEGPHSLELIEDKIKSGYLAPLDYIYNPKVNDWVHLSKFEFTKIICESLHKRDEITKPIEADPTNNWFLLRDNNQIGPFEFKELVTMLHEKKAFEYDFVWAPFMETWERISESGHFTVEKTKAVLDSRKYQAEKQFRRRSPRVPYGASLIIHNNKKIWNATGFEISNGGVGVEVPHQAFKKGEALILHYRPSKEVPAFNVQCEVVNCVKTQAEGEIVKYRLGMRFVRVNSASQKIVQQIVTQKAA